MQENKQKKPMKSQLLPATLTALKIYHILKENSDQDHPIPQTVIARELDVDRKTVGRCLEVMQGYMGYDIVHQRNGVYLIPDDDAFELSEIRLLIDSVLASRVISEEQTDAIVKKLACQLNRHDRTHIRHIHSYKDWSKVDNANVFWTVEAIDDAINKGVKVTFDYNVIGTDKKLHLIGRYEVSPVQLTFSGGCYFVLALTDEDDELRSFRIDRITNARVLGVKAQKAVKGMDAADIASVYVEGHPYMSFGATEWIRMRLPEGEIGRLFDVFGTKVNVSQSTTEDENGVHWVEVTFRANTEDTYRFMVQNADVAEILEPHTLRARILDFGRKMQKRYLSSEQDYAYEMYTHITSEYTGHRVFHLMTPNDWEVRRLIAKNGTADRVWGLTVDSDEETMQMEMLNYKGLKVLDFCGRRRVDLSVLKNYPELEELRIENYGRPTGRSCVPMIRTVERNDDQNRSIGSVKAARERREREKREREESMKPTEVFNLKTVAKCPRLKTLRITNAMLMGDWSLEGSENLRFLSLTDCHVGTFDFVKSLPNLIELKVSGNVADDISGLYGHRRLRRLYVDRAFAEKFDIETLKKKSPHLTVILRNRDVAFERL